jgi:DNA-binding GntR family transcriptional regulator
MAEARAEPFHIVLVGLRERIREGAFRPGARIAATDLADELRLSTTPVREALSRLAGAKAISCACRTPRTSPISTGSASRTC